MNHKVTTVRLWVEIFFASAIGSGELVLMNLQDSHPDIIPCEFIYPFVVGFMLGICGRGPFWIIGPATMLCLPISVIVSVLTGYQGFNLWPIALLFFGFLALIGLFGAFVGRGAKLFWVRLVTKKTN
jgi:hypothetical protein